MATKTVNDFRVGDRVTYVPNHARDAEGRPLLTHPDCEDGVVTSKNDRFVFVKFKPWGRQRPSLLNPRI